MSQEPKRGTIRFEDLGAPIQRLFKSMKGKVSEEDMALVQEFVSVKDMAKIFQEIGSDRGAEAIWAELRAALLQRKEKQMAKSGDLKEREIQLAALKKQQEEDEAEEERQRQEEEERLARKAEKRRKKAAAAAADAEEEERVRLEAEAAEAERVAQEEAEAAAAEKKRKKDEKKRKLREEEERLAAQQAEEAARAAKKANHKKDWEDFVASHPLEYSESAIQDIQQKPKAPEDGLAPRQTLAASAELLTRTWTPYCPHCHAKYSKPPPEWDCSMCLRKFRQHVKCWQPDDKGESCSICKKGIGRFTRHHCRNCGRCVCGTCSDFSAKIASIGYNSPVRVCRQCVDELGTVAQAA